MWYLFLCIIAVATLNNVISILWAWYRRRARARGGNTASSQKKGALNIWRVPDAILAATRIFAFRWRIPAVSMTLLEALLGSIYIVALFTWGFANSRPPPSVIDPSLL